MRISHIIATCTLPLMLASCAGSKAPPPDAAKVNTRSMSIAAQRFNQFCVNSVGKRPDGVDLANSFYGTPAINAIGALKVTGGINTEGIGVQFDGHRNSCIVTASQGKAPDGPAELRALAEAYAARNEGTVKKRSATYFVVDAKGREVQFRYWDNAEGLTFQVDT